MKKTITRWTAEVFIFSGRPNPQWKLPAKKAAEWMKRWEEAPASAKEIHRPSALGYTGCRLQYNEHSYWLVYNGCVSFFDNGRVNRKDDAARQMEFFLLNTADNKTKELLRELKII